MSFIINAFHEGGVFMYFILIFGILSFALIIERVKALYLNYKSVPTGMRQTLLSFIGRADFGGAEGYLRSLGSQSVISNVVLEGFKVRAQSGSEDELQARMDEKLTSELSQLDKRTGFLAMFGNVSTLLGLLGTITGMIHSFAGVASANPADRATMLSKGISEAMNCTAFGLIVAIPALVAYAFLQNKTDRITSELTETTTEVYHDLLFKLESGSAAYGMSSSNKKTNGMTV